MQSLKTQSEFSNPQPVFNHYAIGDYVLYISKTGIVRAGIIKNISEENLPISPTQDLQFPPGFIPPELSPKRITYELISNDDSKFPSDPIPEISIIGFVNALSHIPPLMQNIMRHQEILQVHDSILFAILSKFWKLRAVLQKFNFYFTHPNPKFKE